MSDEPYKPPKIEPTRDGSRHLLWPRGLLTGLLIGLSPIAAIAFGWWLARLLYGR